MITLFEWAIRVQQWTPLELAVVGLVVLLLAGLAIDFAVEAIWKALRARWRLRAVRRLQGGPTHADPARIHRETALELERLARTAPRSDPGAARRLDAGVLVRAAGVHGDLSRRPGEGGSHLRAGREGVRRPAPRLVRDGQSGYGEGTALVAWAPPEERVKVTGP